MSNKLLYDNYNIIKDHKDYVKQKTINMNRFFKKGGIITNETNIIIGVLNIVSIHQIQTLHQESYKIVKNNGEIKNNYDISLMDVLNDNYQNVTGLLKNTRIQKLIRYIIVDGDYLNCILYANKFKNPVGYTYNPNNPIGNTFYYSYFNFICTVTLIIGDDSIIIRNFESEKKDNPKYDIMINLAFCKKINTKKTNKLISTIGTIGFSSLLLYGCYLFINYIYNKRGKVIK
jgi:hypothetical protein